MQIVESIHYHNNVIHPNYYLLSQFDSTSPQDSCIYSHSGILTANQPQKHLIDNFPFCRSMIRIIHHIILSSILNNTSVLPPLDYPLFPKYLATMKTSKLVLPKTQKDFSSFYPHIVLPSVNGPYTYKAGHHHL